MIEKILHIWSAGGWVMWPLLALALMMFFTAVRLWRNLAARPHRRLQEETWKAWVRQPDKGEGEVGEMIRYVLDEARSPRDIHTRFAEVTALTLPPIDRQLQLLGTFVAAAPLVGLLGTVFGMLVTFQALASGGGGGHVTEAMASGISQALFPPEVGLCIALPGLGVHAAYSPASAGVGGVSGASRELHGAMFSCPGDQPGSHANCVRPADCADRAGHCRESSSRGRVSFHAISPRHCRHGGGQRHQRVAAD